MQSTRIPMLALCLALTLCASGCFFRKKKSPAPPAAPPPKPALPTVKPAPPPPKIETGVPQPPPTVSTNLPESPKPPAQKKVVRRPKRVNAQKTDKPAADPGAVPGSESTTPGPIRLGELVPESQRADLVAKCDQSMSNTRASLAKLAAHKLSPNEAEAAERVRAFLLQAESAKMRDPQTALQLAQRAEVLADDLLKSLK